MTRSGSSPSDKRHRAKSRPAGQAVAAFFKARDAAYRGNLDEAARQAAVALDKERLAQYFGSGFAFRESEQSLLAMWAAEASDR